MKENKEKGGNMVAALISSIGVGPLFPFFGLSLADLRPSTHYQPP